MNLVLDVSAAVEILLNRAKSTSIAKDVAGATVIIAPDLYIPELTNVLWKYHKAGLLDHRECAKLADQGTMLIDEFVDARDIYREALSEAIRSAHPAYDLFYLVAARRNDATLLTMDQKLKTHGEKMGVEVILY